MSELLLFYYYSIYVVCCVKTIVHLTPLCLHASLLKTPQLVLNAELKEIATNWWIIKTGCMDPLLVWILLRGWPSMSQACLSTRSWHGFGCSVSSSDSNGNLVTDQTYLIVSYTSRCLFPNRPAYSLVNHIIFDLEQLLMTIRKLQSLRNWFVENTKNWDLWRSTNWRHWSYSFCALHSGFSVTHNSLLDGPNSYPRCNSIKQFLVL